MAIDVNTQSSRGTNVRYAYDSDGHLDAVEVNGRKLAYRYDRNHRLIQLAIDDAPVLRNEYDDAGRLTRQLDGAGKLIEVQKVEDTKDGGRRIVRTIANGMSTAIYDNRLRPLEVRKGNDFVTYAYYPSGTLKGITAIRRPDLSNSSGSVRAEEVATVWRRL